MTNTKQEMIQAYNTLLKQLEEKQAGELKPPSLKKPGKS